MKLIEITHGAPDACRDLLHNAGFEGLGTEAFGGDAIAELFRAHPLSWDGAAEAVVHSRFAAVFGRTGAGASALFADIYNGHIARLWLLGNDTAGYPPVAKTPVPADFDCDQRRAVFGFEPGVFPALAADHTDRVTDFGQALVDGAIAFPGPAARHGRVRPVVLRAFSDGARTAVLFAVQSVGDLAAGGPVVSYAGAMLGDDERLVSDGAGLAVAADW